MVLVLFKLLPLKPKYKNIYKSNFVYYIIYINKYNLIFITLNLSNRYFLCVLIIMNNNI